MSLLSLGGVLLFLTLRAYAAPPTLPWTVADAPYRAVLRLGTLPRVPETGISIELPDLGLSRPDMADFLLTDSAGKALPLAKVATRLGGQVLLLAQEMPRKKGPCFLYFGGGQTRNAPSWTPKLSLFLETRRAPANLKFDTWQDVEYAWNAAPEIDGSGFVWCICHGDNPFGLSRNFLTHFTGYLPVEKEKDILFYTLSSDASFVLFDNRLQLSWPGQHTPVATANNVHSQTIHCLPPSVKIDYYAAKGTAGYDNYGDQAAMLLGLKEPDGKYSAVHGETYLHPGTTVLQRIEDAHGLPVPRPKIDIDSTIGYGGQWLYETRFGFQEPAQEMAGWSAKWEFDDGATVSGLEGKRVVANPQPQMLKVLLTPVLSATSALVHPVPPLKLLTRMVFSERVPRASIRDAGDVRRYAAMLDADTLSQLKPASIAARLALLLEWGTDQQITKFSDALPEQDRMINDPDIAPTWATARLIAIRTHAAENPAKALSDLAALEPRIRQRFPLSAEPLEMDLRVFYLQDADCAGRLNQIAFQNPNSYLAKLAKIRIGDFCRLQGKIKDAIAQYQVIGIKADDRSLPAQDRAFSIAINELIANNHRSEAMAKLTEWELKHPMAKFDGDFLLLRARTLMFFGRWSEAMLETESFQRIQPESPFQIDAQFLRARVLYERNAKDEARKIWKAIASNYPKHPLAEEAKAWAAKP